MMRESRISTSNSASDGEEYDDAIQIAIDRAVSIMRQEKQVRPEGLSNHNGDIHTNSQRNKKQRLSKK
jgi:hypothetical protein